MGDITPVRESFPHTETESVHGFIRQSRELRLKQVARRDFILPYVVRFVCAQIDISERALFSRSQVRSISRPRQLIYWILRHHPSASLSYPVIGEAFDRDHTTIMHGVQLLHERLCDGYDAHNAAFLQKICDHLARKGFTPFSVAEAINEAP